MIDYYEFQVLANSAAQKSTQRDIAAKAGISVGSVNKAVASLQEKGLLNSSAAPTSAGIAALEPYRVDNAIILAAGMATRFAPLSFEKPKALFEVQGEILIERLIRQLKEAGIDDITVVVGYMKESFFYLEDKFGVKIAVSNDYSKRNNHSSLLAVKNTFGNTYLCSSDLYFEKNVFSPYSYGTWVTCVKKGGPDDRYILKSNRTGQVSEMSKTGTGHYEMRGPAHFTKDDATRLIAHIEDEYDQPETAPKLWDDILAEHLDEFSLRARILPKGVMHEFNYVQDLASFDADFFENVDSRILENICRALECKRSDIMGVEPVKAGLTNLSVLFSCKGKQYIYRHPGVGTEEIVNRRAEAHALEIAKKLSLDETYVYEDPEEGWKISAYIPGCEEFDYHNPAHVKQAMQILRTLHTSGEVSPWSFDFHDEGKRIVKLLKDASYPLPRDFDSLSQEIDTLASYLKLEAGAPVLCHNDFYGPNLLVKGDEMQLIDWEYAAMGDYGCDLGNFVSQGSGYSIEQAESLVSIYFGREATAEEVRHCLGCTAVVGWYWYVWSIYKEMQGNPVGEWLYIWYKAAKQFCAHVLPQYRANAPQAIGAQGGTLAKEEFDRLVALERAGKATPEQLELLEPYRAKRAILFAAGFGSRMRPITISTPKPLVRVHGTRIIDRLIDALLSVGVDEIYIVRGYLKDSFDQLLAKYPTLKFIDNPLFDTTNNISSALVAKDHFENAYAFESDLLIENTDLITKYQYASNYLAIPVERTDDWYFDASEDGVITHIAKGKGAPCWQMVGCSYWSAADGKRLSRDIPEVFARGGECEQIFWDDVALDRKPEDYAIHVRQCTADDITEIDSFAELQEIDPAYRID